VRSFIEVTLACGAIRMKPALTYCTNVHPGETLAEVEASLDRFTVPLKRALAPAPFPADRPFPIGLYLSAAAARELAEPARLAGFRRFLEQRGLEIVTLNCFPYGGFHAERVKLDVYRPTWLEDRRVEFTLAAARALAQLAPAGAVAPISTLGGSCKLFGDGEEVRRAIAANLGRMALELARLHERTGREIILSLEPEPFSTLETTEEAARFFTEHVFGEAGRAAFIAAGGAPSRADAMLRRHVGVCFDACHQAVEFEDARHAVARLRDAGVRIGKVQLSSALRVPSPARSAERFAALSRYSEARYLHQAFARRSDGSIERRIDLPELLAMPREELARMEEVRVHFHVPIDRDALGPLETTRDFLLAVIEGLRDHAACFEVETYTFPVLPDGPDDDSRLVAALAAELRFAVKAMAGP
jgi:sugar phosphate isomerase/epimerase